MPVAGKDARPFDRLGQPSVQDRVPGGHERPDLTVRPRACRQPHRRIREPLNQPPLRKARLGANKPVADSHLDHPVWGGAAKRRLVVPEESRRDDLRPQELDALGREALLEEAARPAIRSLGQVGVFPQPDQPPVGVHPGSGSPEPVLDDQLSALRSARRSSHRRQADEALVKDELAHDRPSSGCQGRDERERGQHDDKPATPLATVPSCACSIEDIAPVPGERLGRECGESTGQPTVFVHAHVLTSFVERSPASCRCACDSVAATVPSATPSTSPMLA